MKGHFSYLYQLIFLLLLALSASSPAMAQQGQYSFDYAPFKLPSMSSLGGFATYAPIKSVDAQKIELRSDDGKLFTFTLGAGTIYCRGNRKASDWSYLKRVGKKTTVTVMTNSDADTQALVIWDQRPSISAVHGPIEFSLPPMCQ
jgi:hypothetical protein